MLKKKPTYLVLLIAISFSISSFAQKETNSAIAEAANGLKLREIGPALMGGRIADIAVSPTDPTTWYVAAGSGNLWKTTNSGITWQAVFEKEASYSIGTVTIDPNNPEVVWVGTGENVAMGYIGLASDNKLGLLFHTVDGTVSRATALGGVVTYFTS